MEKEWFSLKLSVFFTLLRGVVKGSPLVDKGIRHETRQWAVPPSILRLLLPKEVPLNEGYSVFHCFHSRTEELLTPSHRLSHILHIFMSFFTILDCDTTDIHCNPISREKKKFGLARTNSFFSPKILLYYAPLL